MPNSEQNVQDSIESTGGIPEITMTMQVSGMTQMPVDKTLTLADMAADAKATGDAIANLAADISDINDWTGDDIYTNATEKAQSGKKIRGSISDLNTAVTGVSDRVTAVEAWTGEDIPATSAQGSPSIASRLTGIVGEAYPIGSVYISTSSEPPSFEGTWVEIAVTATWNQLKTGRRGYSALGTGEEGGPLHFWLRIEPPAGTT